MAVALTVQLPEQPATGSVEEVPLAGDGIVSPHSETHVHMVLEADATAGLLVITIQLDPRWSCLLNYCNWQCASLADRKGCSWRIQAGPDFFLGANMDLGTGPNFSAVGSDNNSIWCPPPQMLFVPGMTSWAPNIVFTTDNTDTEDVELFVLIYNFRKDAPKRIPVTVLNSALPRGSVALN